MNDEKSKTKIMRVVTILCFVMFMTGCTSDLHNKLDGLWSVDINNEVIEKNGWHDLLGNGFALNSDFSCTVSSFNDPKKRIGWLNNQGTWRTISNENGEFLDTSLEE